MIYFAKWKIVLVAVVCALGIFYAAPNVVDRSLLQGIPDGLPNKQISLGLDLQGGSHLLLEVQVDAVIRERLVALVDAARTELRRSRIGYRGLGIQGQGIAFTVREPGKVDEARRIARRLETGTETEVSGDRFTITLTEQTVRDVKTSAVNQSIEIVRRRIDETGVREPAIQRQGADRILVQLPGVKDPERIKRLLGKTAKMNFRLVDQSMSAEQARRGRPPPGSELLPADNEVGPDGEPVQYLVRKRVMVGGDTLVDAQPTVQEAQPVVSFRFDAVGARRFGDTTRRNVGRPFAIVLDGKVISAPVIREPILGGSGIISGNFTVQSARRPRAAAARRRAAGAAHRARGAHRRPRYGRRFDPRREDRKRAGDRAGDRLHGGDLRHLRGDGRHRTDAQHDPDRCRAVGCCRRP